MVILFKKVSPLIRIGLSKNICLKMELTVLGASFSYGAAFKIEAVTFKMHSSITTLRICYYSVFVFIYQTFSTVPYIVRNSKITKMAQGLMQCPTILIIG